MRKVLHLPGAFWWILVDNNGRYWFCYHYRTSNLARELTSRWDPREWDKYFRSNVRTAPYINVSFEEACIIYMSENPDG